MRRFALRYYWPRDDTYNEKDIPAKTWKGAMAASEEFFKDLGLVAMVEWLKDGNERHRLYRKFKDDGGVDFDVGAFLREKEVGKREVLTYTWPGKRSKEGLMIPEMYKDKKQVEGIATMHLLRMGMEPVGEWFSRTSSPWWAEQGLRCRVFVARDRDGQVIFSTVAELRLVGGEG